MRATALFLALAASTVLFAEPNLTNVSVETEQRLEYTVYTIDDTERATLEETDGALSHSISRSGDRFGNDWSVEASAEIQSDYTLEHGTDSLTFTGTASTTLSYTESPENEYAKWTSGTAFSDTPLFARNGNRIDLFFTVEKYWVDYELNFEILERNVGECQVYLTQRIYPDDSPPFYAQYELINASNQNYSISGTLPAGEYGLLIVLRGSDNFDASVTYSLELAPDLDDPLILDPPPGGYSHPKIGQIFQDSGKLLVKNVAITKETDLGNGTTELEVTADLENTSSQPWSYLHLDILSQLEDAPELVSTTPYTFESIEAKSTVSVATDTPLKAVVANEHLEALKASLLDASRFTTDGRELYTFNYPPVPYDFHESYWGDGTTLEYQGAPPVERGQLIIVTDQFPIEPEDVRDDENPNPTPRFTQSIDTKMPFLVHGVTEPAEGSLYSIYEINGEQVTALDHMITGTLISELPRIHPRSGIESTGSPGFKGANSPAAFPHPLHFNHLPITTDFELSGSFAVVPDDFRVKLEMVEGIVTQLYAEGTLTVDVNFLLEAHAATDNADSEKKDRTHTLLDLPLFYVVLPSGLTFSPEIKIDVSALATAEAGISIPITSGIEMIFRGGIVDGHPQYDCEINPIPTRLTNPSIFSAANATFTAEAETELYLKFSKPETLVSFGPTFSTALVGQFELDALADPAWTLGADLELRAGMEFQLAGFFDLVDVEKPLFTTPIFSIDSGAPLGGNPTVQSSIPNLQSSTDNPGIKPIEGESNRWIRALRPNQSLSATDNLFLFPLPGTDRIIAGGSAVTNGEIACFDSEGGLLWMLNATYIRPIDAVPHPDGTFTVLSGTPFRIQLTRFDAEGETVWTKTYFNNDVDEAYHFENKAIAYGTNPDGTPFYAVLSRGAEKAPPFLRRPAISVFDDDGNRLWQKLYTPDENPDASSNSTEPENLIITNDGHIAYVAQTHTNLTPQNDGTFSNAAPNLTENGLVAKVSSTDGAPLWATIIGTVRIPELHALAQDPDGNYYFGGGVKLVVYDSIPSMWLGKLSAEGAFIDSVTIGAPSAALPNGGQSLYDVIRDMVWADGALWICGKSGFYNSGVGYFTGSHAFTARVTPKLGVTRFAFHAGPAYDDLTAIADGGNGLLAYGTSASFLPWPHGGASEADPGDRARLLMKLPWEGVTRFHSASAGAHPEGEDITYPAQGTYYAYPTVVAGGDTGLFAAIQPGPSEEIEFQTSASSLAFTTSEMELTETTPALAPSLQDRLAYVALEAVPEDVIQTADDYLAWLQSDGSTDSDGDSWSDDLEIFFGTDPLKKDSPALKISLPKSEESTSLKITLPRSPLPNDKTLAIEISNDLLTWSPFSDFSQSQENLEDITELTLLSQLPGADSFLRFRLANANDSN